MLSQAIQKTTDWFPATTRTLLRQYLRRGGWVPQRGRWLVEDLKKRVVPQPSQRIIRLTASTVLEVDLANAIGRDLYFYGSHEQTLERVLRRIVKPGAVFIDAGANIGEISLLAAELVGSTGRVYAFEVAPTTLPRLKKNVALNHAKNVEVVVAAVCDEDREMEFHLGAGTDSGSSSLTKPHDYCGESLKIAGVRLDTFASERGLERIDIIKMDVEGAELAALRGCQKLLDAALAPIVIFEFHRVAAQRMGWTVDDATEFLRSHQFESRYLADEQDRQERCNIVAAKRDAWVATGLRQIGDLFRGAQ